MAGYTAWHIPRTQDTFVQTWIRGTAEVMQSNRWSKWQALKQNGIGAIQRYDEQAKAVSHRNAKYVIAINTGCADPKDTGKQVQWTRDLWTAIRPFSSGGVYVNFLSADDGEDRVRAAYGATKFERLVQLKSKYDPYNLFQLNQNIKPVM